MTDSGESVVVNGLCAMGLKKKLTGIQCSRTWLRILPRLSHLICMTMLQNVETKAQSVW